MPDFLLEIGTEEIPARMIDGAKNALQLGLQKFLRDSRLWPEQAAIEAFATPRRLAILARGVLVTQPDAQENVNGPAVKVAFKDGTPTPAAEAFAKRVGKPVSELKTVNTAKGEYLSATIIHRGRSAKDVLAEALPKEIAAISWPKSMYWRAGKPERFVRPLRWMVALLDSEIVNFEFGGIASGDTTRGHRILSRDAEIQINSATDYEKAMQQGSVVANPETRMSIISEQLESLARAQNLRIRGDAYLLNTVVNLTESPSVILGSFDPEYLALPEEVLVTVMRDHQKYFAVEDEHGKLAPYFLAVINIGLCSTGGPPVVVAGSLPATSSAAAALITHGNERVLCARFNDARFFWNTDQRIPLMDRGPMLAAVTFQKDLGSYAQKSARMTALVNWMVPQVAGIDAGAAETAASLAKCDLTTELVKEFTELQGIVGGLYARAQGHTDAVADAIYDQYKPVSAEADAPRFKEGALVSIADKADSIAGMFAIGLIPSGSKDPFALRRQANGIVKTVHAHNLPFTISALMDAALHAYDGSEAQARFRNSEYAASFAGFFRERLEFYLKDTIGYAYDVVHAVLAVAADDVSDAVLRAQAVAEARGSAGFDAIAVSFKRIKNILRQATQENLLRDDFTPALTGFQFKQPEEHQLAKQAQAIATEVRTARKHRDYLSAVREIAKIRPALDLFFDRVMVMVKDEDLRAQRLALLSFILAEFSTVADFSEIVSAEK